MFPPSLSFGSLLNCPKAKEAIEKSLVKYESAADLIVNAIKEVEDFPYFSQ